MYYDKDGHRLTREEFLRLFENDEYRQVEWTKVKGGHVSTVWLGLDHSFGQGKPVIFETMHFPSNDCTRASTLLLARLGHAQMVARWTKGSPE